MISLSGHKLPVLVERSQYRVHQFLHGFRTSIDPDDLQRIVSLLSENELKIFLSMQPRERRHGVDTMRHVDRLAADHGTVATNELLTAALLHDAGKGTIRVEDRIIYVLLKNGAPDLLERLAHADGTRWRSALWRLCHHAELAASQFEEIGLARRVIELTAAHHRGKTTDDDLELAWLIEADTAL